MLVDLLVKVRSNEGLANYITAQRDRQAIAKHPILVELGQVKSDWHALAVAKLLGSKLQMVIAKSYDEVRAVLCGLSWAGASR